MYNNDALTSYPRVDVFINPLKYTFFTTRQLNRRNESRIDAENEQSQQRWSEKNYPMAMAAAHKVINESHIIN